MKSWHLKKVQKVPQLLTIMLKKLNNWGFLNFAGNKGLKRRNREVRYTSMAILETGLKAWKKKRECLTFPCKVSSCVRLCTMVRCCVTVPFQKVICLSLYFKYLLFFTQINSNILFLYSTCNYVVDLNLQQYDRRDSLQTTVVTTSTANSKAFLFCASNWSNTWRRFYKIQHQALVQEKVAKQDNTIELLCIFTCIING
jgi:hypothetical protein